MEGHERREKSEDFRITNNDGGGATALLHCEEATKDFLISDSIAKGVITIARQMSREIRAREKWEKLPGTKTPMVNN